MTKYPLATPEKEAGNVVEVIAPAANAEACVKGATHGPSKVVKVPEAVHPLKPSIPQSLLTNT